MIWWSQSISNVSLEDYEVLFCYTVSTGKEILHNSLLHISFSSSGNSSMLILPLLNEGP